MFTWLRLPRRDRARARKLALSGRPHPDPRVREAAQGLLLSARWPLRIVSFAFYAGLAYRGVVDPASSLWGSLATMLWFGLVLAWYPRVRRTAVWQWPAMAADASDPPRPVRLRAEPWWGAQSVLRLTQFAVAVAVPLGWWWRRAPGDGWLPVAVVLVGSALVLGVAASWRRLRIGERLVVDEQGVRLPIRGLSVGWDQITAVCVGDGRLRDAAERAKDRSPDEATGLTLVLRDPAAVWAAAPRPAWRRLLGLGPEKDLVLHVSVEDVHGSLFPAYRAANVFHAAHRGAAVGAFQ